MVYLAVWGRFSHYSQGERVERVAERKTATAAPCLSLGLLRSLESAVKACFGFARFTRVIKVTGPSMVTRDRYKLTTTTVKTGELVLALNWQVGRGGSGSGSGTTRPKGRHCLLSTAY